jgi:hypothetical protein
MIYNHLMSSARGARSVGACPGNDRRREEL